MLIEAILIVYSPALCEQKWEDLNNGKNITKQEISVCRKDITKHYRKEIKVEYKKYKENKYYCNGKYLESIE